MNRIVEVVQFVTNALESTVFLAPTDQGLTAAELVDLGRSLGYEAGEVGDAINASGAQQYWGSTRIMPRANIRWPDFHLPERSDFRNVKAFDFVYEQLQALVRSEGTARASMERSVLVERGVSKGLPRIDLEAAIAINILAGRFLEADGIVRFSRGAEHYIAPSKQLASAHGHGIGSTPPVDPMRVKVHELVRGAIKRRTDGRPPSAEPLEAFTTALETLGYGHFSVWWSRAVAELKHLDPSITPVAVSVAAAAIVEGALAFVVRHAQNNQLGTLASKDFLQDPRSWKVRELVKSAASGGGAAILDIPSRHRADALIVTRQRIHAGGMLSEYPSGVPDLRPEEARDAKATAETVVRKVLDWLEKYPPAARPDPV